ncbi:MAG: carboxypeptidase regulatory-like domain-containing protein, partial [Planctomycetes bacterium]|nr:carboxypeptidase regulatory-like domain-containing protein [Planctomycetota bacterium]
GAEVSALIQNEDEPRRGPLYRIEHVITKTDAEGKFKFANIPVDAKAEFIVKAPGKAGIFTMKNPQGEFKCTYAAGQEDIKIVLPPEAVIEGKVVVKESGQPRAGIEIIAMKDPPASATTPSRAVSAEDGSFKITNLEESKYKLTLIPSTNETPEWITTPVMVETKAGETKADIKIELEKGVVFEVVVTAEADNAPLSGAQVSVYREAPQEYFAGMTDKEGIARIRLLPGEYRLNYIGKEGYLNYQPNEQITLVAGETTRKEAQLKVQPKITGTIMNPDGKPLAGVNIKILPSGGQGATTDKEGKFTTTAQRWGGMEDMQLILVARDQKNNLAATYAIEDEAKPIELNLAPAATFTGQVTDENDKPLPDAQVYIMLNSGRYGSTLTQGRIKVDAEGRYELNAIPTGYRYDVNAQAEGYGQARTNHQLAEDEAEKIELETLVLPMAILSISGTVVDADDKLVEGAEVYVYGDKQPHRQAQTDKEGKFKIDNIVAGELQVNAHLRGGNNQNGMVRAQGGDTEIKVVLGQYPGQRPQVPEATSLLGKPLPSLEDFGLQPASELAQGKRVVICFWDMEQRPSRRMITILAGRAEELAQKNVILLSVQGALADEADVQDWAEQAGVTIPIGKVPEEKIKRDKLLRSWGVSSMPWLIVVDEGHIVRREGITLEQFDALLAAHSQ